MILIHVSNYLSYIGRQSMDQFPTRSTLSEIVQIHIKHDTVSFIRCCKAYQHTFENIILAARYFFMSILFRQPSG